MKQYNKDKPDKWGFKDFAICEAATGYCMYFYPYQGKDQQRPENQSLAEFAVRAVLQPCFWYSGYLVAMDNWFVCFAGLLFCLSVGVNVVGTLRRGRTGFPVKSLLEMPADTARGTIKVLRHSAYSIYCCLWKDNKIVRMVSTFDFEFGTCLRRVKGQGRTKVPLPQPQCIGCYNGGMGGCDLGDQCKAYIRPVIRSVVITYI